MEALNVDLDDRFIGLKVMSITLHSHVELLFLQIPICSSGVRSLGFILAHSVIQCDSPPSQVLQTLLKVRTLVI